ncbi:carboxypeptidase regulatory-like domain-containing protein [Candidatus Microgenomates bacterium]|nr:carboxypeptidase regulatory-like domain-containing protein [Candidatus Microgenomates bacterium]
MCEYGAPIPDIHGNLTEDQQNELIRRNLMALVEIRDIVGGINYWTAFGGSTEIFNGADKSPRKAAKTLESYYNPLMISGNIQDEFGGAISGATVSNGVSNATTNILGNYSLMATPDHLTLAVTKNNFKSQTIAVAEKDGEKNYSKNVALITEKHDFGYYVRKIVHSLTTFTFY